jgi:hypothetical protein
MPLTLHELVLSLVGNPATTSRKAWLKLSPGIYPIKIGAKQFVKRLVMTAGDLVSIRQKRIDLI